MLELTLAEQKPNSQQAATDKSAPIRRVRSKRVGNRNRAPISAKYRQFRPLQKCFSGIHGQNHIGAHRFGQQTDLFHLFRQKRIDAGRIYQYQRIFLPRLFNRVIEAVRGFDKAKIGSENIGKSLQLAVGAGPDIVGRHDAGAQLLKFGLRGGFGDCRRFSGTRNAHKHLSRLPAVQNVLKTKHFIKTTG